MKFANRTMRAEGIFFYMMATAVALIPAAVAMTDFTRPIEWGVRGPVLAAFIQVLNSIGALTLVYAMRYGKAMIVAPMTALAPVLTVLISLALYRVMPNPVIVVGMVCASVAIYLLAE
jgi:drug/metabolite transporter (DMT)-like permease